jgi:DNA repair exonuclease SbcCD ATPase subunit
LAESLSPKSIRIMAEGYESLLQTRKRLKTQEDELEQRKLELSSLNQRIEGLVRQVASQRSEDPDAPRSQRELRREELRPDENRREENRPRDSKARNPDERLTLVKNDGPATQDASNRQLQDLTGLLALQNQYTQQFRTLKDEDQHLAKQQKAMQRSIDKHVLSRQSFLADLGVENQEQLDQQLELKQEHAKLQREIHELDQRIRALLGGNASHDAVARLVEGLAAGELEKRWSSLQERIQQAQQRVSQLHQRQGETSQEMKTLAADRRLGEVKLELACVEKQLEACSQHWQTLAATTHMLERVCEVYETERQPETLREASTFLKHLTDGKYVRVWTPLGKNALRIDNQQGQSLPLEVLSRGTREAVFIALRLSLAAAYARRGVALPLVMDDVLVNFDTIRAKHAAAVLRDYAELGNQVVMFTCHEHIMRMFHDIGVQVRVLPNQGQPGEARIYVPETRHTFEPPRPVQVVVETPTRQVAHEEIPYEEPVIEPPVEKPIYDEPFPAAPEKELVYWESVPPVEMEQPSVVAEPVAISRPRRTPRRPRPRPTALPPQPEPILDSISAIDRLWYELDPVSDLWRDYEHIPDSPPSADLWWESKPR